MGCDGALYVRQPVYDIWGRPILSLLNTTTNANNNVDTAADTDKNMNRSDVNPPPKAWSRPPCLKKTTELYGLTTGESRLED
jgi:hypothetical protein